METAPTIRQMLIGTLANVAAVIAGTAVGALAGRRFPERLRETVMATLGLLASALAVREVIGTEHFPLVLAAVLVGAVAGELMHIEGGLIRLGDFLQRKIAGKHEVDIDIGAPETATPPEHSARFSEGFVLASLIFCVGPLAVIGSIEDGLGNPELLLVKAALDGFASIAFASVYGWGVGLSALSVGVLQGGIALGGRAIESVLTDSMLSALGAAGGILLFGIALRLLNLKEIRVANLLPAVVLAPLFVWLWG
jgi:uncharacterized membrane protein YqgA involved in biofilm formation